MNRGLNIFPLNSVVHSVIVFTINTKFLKGTKDEILRKKFMQTDALK